MKILLLLFALTSPLLAEGKKFTLTARASEIDTRTKEHPEIDYVFSRKGKPADNQFASVDTRVKDSGYLVIWLMEPKPELFDRLNSYGHHAIQVTYPREWFAKMDKLRKDGDDGWKNHHYCRSWLMLGLHKFGPVVNVDESKPPYGNTRRLISTEASIIVADRRQPLLTAFATHPSSLKFRAAGMMFRAWPTIPPHPNNPSRCAGSC